jgi:hypothetical protein
VFLVHTAPSVSGASDPVYILRVNGRSACLLMDAISLNQ